MNTKRLFELFPSGDSYSLKWDVREYESSYDGKCYYRGDLSSMYSRKSLIRRLRELYPECEIRVGVK